MTQAARDRRRNAVMEDTTKLKVKVNGKVTPHSPRAGRRNAQVPKDTEKPTVLHQPVKRKMHRRAMTTGNIELIAASQANQVKIVIMGAGKTGKTALLVRFMTKRFIADYGECEMRYNHFTIVDNEIAYYDLLDTSYDKAIHNGDLYENKIKWGDAFIILYDINDSSSFDEVTRIRYLISYHHTPQKLRQIKNNLKKKIYDNFSESTNKKAAFEAEQYFNPPVILLGNKAESDRQRQIPRSVAKAKAQELDCGFEEISAMNSSHDDIRQVFDRLYRGIRAQEKRTKINHGIKLLHVDESSDPRKNPHSSPILIRKPVITAGPGLTMRKGRHNVDPNAKSFSLGPT